VARTLYARGDRLIQCGAVAVRIFRKIDGSVSMVPLAGYIPAAAEHNHYEVSSWVQNGVAGHFWLACGTTNSPAWGPHGGGERLRWLPAGVGTVPYDVIEVGQQIYRPSQIFLWIPDNLFVEQNIHPGVRQGNVYSTLNQEMGPAGP